MLLALSVLASSRLDALLAVVVVLLVEHKPGPGLESATVAVVAVGVPRTAPK